MSLKIEPVTVSHSNAFGEFAGKVMNDNVKFLFLSVWIAVGVFLILRYLISCRKDYIMLQDAVPIEDDLGAVIWPKNKNQKISLLQSDKIETPITYGILYPRIILPKDKMKFKLCEAECVLMHELNHIKNHDNFWKPFSDILSRIYWFEPLVWIVNYFMMKDMEFCADENVIRVLGEEKRRTYAELLLEYQVEYSRRNMVGSGFAESIIKERIESIMRFNKQGKVIMPLCVGVCLLGMLSFVVPKVSAEPKETFSSGKMETEGTYSKENETLFQDEQKSNKDIEPMTDSSFSDVQIKSNTEEKKKDEDLLNKKIEQVKAGKIVNEEAEKVADQLHEENRKIIAAYEKSK